MTLRLGLVAFALGCVTLCGRANADTKVGDFEALNHDQRVACLTKLTNGTLDKIEAKNPVLALRIQEYFIMPEAGEKYGRGAKALMSQINEYNRVDPNGYTVENAFAKVLTDYLALNAGKRPATEPATQPTPKRSS